MLRYRERKEEKININMNKDLKLLQEIYDKVGKRQYDMLFDWLGGSEEDVLGGGLYPGVSGLDAVKNMVLDSQTMEDENPKSQLAIAAAIETLNEKKVLELILNNYDGERLDGMPSSVQEFHSGTDDEYFQAPDTTEANNAFQKAIRYFKQELNEIEGVPEWAEKRDDAMYMREILVTLKRNKV